MTEHRENLVREKPVRRLYEKPEIRMVELKPEEALSAGCKTMTPGSCGPPGDCIAAGCFSTYGS